VVVASNKQESSDAQDRTGESQQPTGGGESRFSGLAHFTLLCSPFWRHETASASPDRKQSPHSPGNALERNTQLSTKVFLAFHFAPCSLFSLSTPHQLPSHSAVVVLSCNPLPSSPSPLGVNLDANSLRIVLLFPTSSPKRGFGFVLFRHLVLFLNFRLSFFSPSFPSHQAQRWVAAAQKRNLLTRNNSLNSPSRRRILLKACNSRIRNSNLTEWQARCPFLSSRVSGNV
jgi:hypothetical protein